jgi:hypothetical protein
MATEQQAGTQDGATQDQEAAKAAAADQAAQQQEQQDNAGDAAKEGTTVSGDSKGETQTVTKEDVGSVTDALGLGLAGDAATAAIASATDAAAKQAQADADAQAAAKAAAAAAPATATVRKTIPAPANVATGAKAPAPTTASTPAAAVVTKQVAAAATVTNTAAAAPANDRDLPEVVAAMKVAKPQTQSALYQVIQYAADLHPGKRVELSTIEQAQINLRSNLFTILSAEDTNFKVAYQALLAIVRAHKNNCFAITARNRGLNTVSVAALDNKGMRFLTKIVDLLVLTAGTNNLEQVKAHYDFSKMAEWCPNVRIQQNLTSYYSA